MGYNQAPQKHKPQAQNQTQDLPKKKPPPTTEFEYEVLKVKKDGNCFFSALCISLGWDPSEYDRLKT